MLLKFNYIINNPIKNDAPNPWGIYFQDGASPVYEGIVELHDQVLFYLIIILVGVTWIIFSTVSRFSKSSIIHKYYNHSTSIELI